MLEVCQKSMKSCILRMKIWKKKKENTKSSKRNCLDIEVIKKGIEQQKRLLSIDKLNLALSSLMRKN